MNSRERRIPNWIERFAPVMCLIVLAGCATIISGRKQDVSISSEPTAANVSVDAFNYGKTPVMIYLAYCEDRAGGVRAIHGHDR